VLQDLLSPYHLQARQGRLAPCRSIPPRMRGYKAVNDLVDADTGKVVGRGRARKLTVRQGAAQLAEKGFERRCASTGRGN